jgi:fatty acid desaturase
VSPRKSPNPAFHLELPTLAVALGVYGGFLVWSWYFSALPLWLGAACGAVLIAWHGSLQHETIHGHPTPRRGVNAAIGSVPLSLWIPYPLYRASHILHHRYSGRYLTDPGRDPESFYLPPQKLASLPPMGRWLAQANCTFAGRMLIGPLLSVGTFYALERHALRRGGWPRWRLWMGHSLGVVAVLGWVVGVCHISPAVYLALVVYPGTSLSLVRSFAEHRANGNHELRTAVVETNPVMALIFLNNNLHIAHHARPDVPWYELPALWRSLRESDQGLRAADAGMVYRGGYREVIRRFLVRPVIRTAHPAWQEPNS